jgi:hypothetical protein
MSLDVYLITPAGKQVYSDNITHNLNSMAEKAGIYKHLWRPEEIDIKVARDLIRPLMTGLRKLAADREFYEQYNPTNKWGSYDGLMRFTADYLEACIKHPKATIQVSR